MSPSTRIISVRISDKQRSARLREFHSQAHDCSPFILAAVVTLQENNAIALIDLATGEVIRSFSAGSVDLTGIDAVEDNVITQTDSQSGRLREPDAVAWIGTEYFATADEGDLDGGSRTFTIFDVEGNVVYSSASELDDWVVRIGQYPESRSDAKGSEPETVRYADFGDAGKLLFINAERSNAVFVYDVSNVTQPKFRQVLPTGGSGPEGVFAIPQRNLFVVANENDSRADKFRAAVSIFELQEADHPMFQLYGPVKIRLESTFPSPP